MKGSSIGSGDHVMRATVVPHILEMMRYRFERRHMIKRHILSSTLGVALISFLPSLVSGQTNTGARNPQSATPSLAEATRFIGDALSSNGKVAWRNLGKSGWESHYFETTKLLRSEGCKLVFEDNEESTTLYSPDRDVSRSVFRRFSVDLKNLDPASGRVKELPAVEDDIASRSQVGFAV